MSQAVWGHDENYYCKYCFSNSPIDFIYIPKKVATIGNYAFYGCYALTDAIFTAYCESSVNIGIDVFTGSSVTSIHLPDEPFPGSSSASCANVHLKI